MPGLLPSGQPGCSHAALEAEASTARLRGVLCRMVSEKFNFNLYAGNSGVWVNPWRDRACSCLGAPPALGD